MKTVAIMFVPTPRALAHGATPKSWIAGLASEGVALQRGASLAAEHLGLAAPCWGDGGRQHTLIYRDARSREPIGTVSWVECTPEALARAV